MSSISQSSLRSGLRAFVNALPIAAPLRSGVRLLRQSFEPATREDAELDLIRAHIDVGYYRKTYPNTASLDPALHYHESGWREGHNPTVWFDTNAYLAANPDVREAAIDPFLHYLRVGQAERRALRLTEKLDLIRAHLDVEYYRQMYPDTASLDAALHYHESGWREGHNPTAWFDTNAYLAANPDVREADIDPFLHYLQFGEVEQRPLRPRSVLFGLTAESNPLDDFQVLPHP